MEMEFFLRPDPAEELKWFEYWVDARFRVVREIWDRSGPFALRPHSQDELSHYSRGTTDIEYLYPFGWGELEGIARRGSFDLEQHALHSNKDLELLRGGK